MRVCRGAGLMCRAPTLHAQAIEEVRIRRHTVGTTGTRGQACGLHYLDPRRTPLGLGAACMGCKWLTDRGWGALGRWPLGGLSGQSETARTVGTWDCRRRPTGGVLTDVSRTAPAQWLACAAPRRPDKGRFGGNRHFCTRLDADRGGGPNAETGCCYCWWVGWQHCAGLQPVLGDCCTAAAHRHASKARS